MQKIQVFLPKRTLVALREIAKSEDRTLGEVIRGATERFVQSYPFVKRKQGGAVLRTVDCGPILADEKPGVPPSALPRFFSYDA